MHNIINIHADVLVGVRGMPERDIESLGVMGWGLDAARRFFRRRRRRRRPLGPGPGPRRAGIFVKTKKNRSEIASGFPPVSRLDLSYLSENRGKR